MTLTAHAPSYYAHSAHAAPARPPLAGAHEADVCIVGAGYTGLSTGIALAEAGLRVVVLEAAQVGWGASGRNGGQIVHSYSRDIDVIERQHGRAAAEPLAKMMFEGAAVIRERVAKYGIACDLKDGGVYAAIKPNKVPGLVHHKTLWERWGHPGLQLLDTPGGVRSIVGSERYSAVLVDPTGGHFHPLNLALGEAAALESLGGRIHEGSTAVRIARGDPATVHTAQGSVRARFVVVACNAYIGQLEPVLAAKTMPCGTQVVATEPLGDRAADLLPGDHCVEDNNFLLDYFRLSADQRLIYGGGVTYGARDPARVEALVRPNMLKTFPQLAGVKIEFGWTGNFLLTLSRLPQVGRLADNIYYSQGCSGHGVTYTHLIGRVLGEAIRGQAERFDAFARLPHLPFPGGRLLRVPFTALGAVWYELRDRLGV
ncbi:MAG: FAD-binding oxidoreductase [Rubrivivax sp.]|nr:FAD-binding oxidoreductase [Rubrivivax sp.]